MTNLFDFFQKKGASDTKQGAATTNTARANPKRSATTLAASAKVKESSNKKKKMTSSSLVASAPSDEDTDKNKCPTKNLLVVVAPTKKPPVTKSTEKDKNDVDDMILDPPKLRHAAIIGNRRNLNGKNAMASFPGRSKKRESGDEMVSNEEESDGGSKGGKETDDDETTPVVFKYPIGTSIKKLFPAYGWFHGQVVGFRGRFYRIRYEDGDKEEMSEDELDSVVVVEKATSTTKQPPNGAKKNEKKKESVGLARKHTSKTSARNNKSSSKQSMVVDREDDDSSDLKMSVAASSEDEEFCFDNETIQPVRSRNRAARSNSPKRRKIRESPRKKASVDYNEEIVESGEEDDEDEYASDNDLVSTSEDEEIESEPVKNEQGRLKVKPKMNGGKAVPTSTSRLPKKGETWDFLDGKGAKAAKPTRKSAPKTKSKEASTDAGATSSNVRKVVKNPYKAGGDLPIISHPQDMFDDMIQTKLTDNGENPEVLMPLLKALKNRPLRVATMCSGTESPILALDMLTKAIENLAITNSKFKGLLDKEGIDPDRIFQIEHVFSCEIEPFKQAYIERNFHPPVLFRDIRELGNDMAYTAYGALVPVPNKEGDVDLLIAGTSCVDYSNLNNKQKTIDQAGESGQTFFGMLTWIDRAKPPIVIIENVSGAPWERKVELFEERGYLATFTRLDTKDMYIPHTRQRGYLFAIKAAVYRGKKDLRIVEGWKEELVRLKRPASAALDAFMLSNDDPRVLHGRARLMYSGDSSGEGAGNKGDRVGRVDWTKCETRHQQSRHNEELGDKRPLTGWSDSSSTIMPCFGGNWNDWVNQQVHRIHDLMDINTLRMAQEGMDCTYKTMVWNLSQNVDRDTMGKLGLCQCLTPTGVPYVTNRGGPLIGEELLRLQGIPSDDLLLTKESEDNLKDLAGNAMSTTVVGACMLSALTLGFESLGERRQTSHATACIVPSLVPRPLLLESEVEVTQKFGIYEEHDLQLGRTSEFISFSFDSLLKEADASARKCTSEGNEESLPYDSLMICQACDHTASERCALPPRKFEEHEFMKMNYIDFPRLQPSDFRKKLLALLPMRVHFTVIDKEVLKRPEKVDSELWDAWIMSLLECVSRQGNQFAPAEFRFTELKRSEIWTAEFSSVNGGKLELRIGLTGATWLLFAKSPTQQGPLRDALERPLAKMSIISQSKEPSLLKGVWELCLPASTHVELCIKGAGNLVDSWRCKLGLGGSFVDERRFEKLEISTDGNNLSFRSTIDGVYVLLPKCGTACGSLYRKACTEERIYFFLESGRCSMPTSDAFVFSKTKHRTSYGEYREIILQLDPAESFRPVVTEHLNQGVWSVRAITPGTWVSTSVISLTDLHAHEKSFPVKMTTPALTSDLCIPNESMGWKKCPEILSCQVPMTTEDPLFLQCAACESPLELNLQKSKQVFQALSFVTSRFSIPSVFERSNDDSWLLLDSRTCPTESDEEVPCRTCAPDKPDVRWTMIKKGNTQRYIPIEDGREAAAYEKSLKGRPSPWVIRFSLSDRFKNGTGSSNVTLRVGCNAVSLVQRALGLLPRNSPPRRQLIENSRQAGNTPLASLFEWRIVCHKEKSIGRFPKLQFMSNKDDQQASQPPHFKNFGLRQEQLRSLHWMLSQEASTDPFWEEEVSESILPNLGWRAEGRVRRPVLVRGGIIADEVGYGKTAITLGLIDSSSGVGGQSPGPPEDCQEIFLTTNATLIVVPSHLMGQWPQEIQKFLGTSKKVCVLNNMGSMNKVTIQDLQQADIVVVNFTVLCSEPYFSRLFRLAGVDPDSLPSGLKGGRHFDAVYEECLKSLQQRVSQLRTECDRVYTHIEQAADENDRRKANTNGCFRLDGKKTQYKKEKKSSSSSDAKTSRISGSRTIDRDPWGLSTMKVKKNFEKMTCPPLELFYWNRIVVDEFTYLSKQERARALSLILRLRSSYRWCLSGTPPHASFDDIQSLAGLLRIHLGVDDVLPFAKVGGRGKRSEQERTGLENLSLFLEVHSMQWHERRHVIAQKFLDRFVRQNIAEIDEIPFEEHVVHVDLSSAERAVYTELDTHLKSLDMNNKKALKSKIGSRGDRENRMHQALEGSGSAEEALLKRCCHFDSSSLKDVYKKRNKDKENCEEELVNSIAAAFRQRNVILQRQPDWAGNKLGEKGEVQDQLGMYLIAVNKHDSVSGGADDEVHNIIKRLVQKAQKVVAKDPMKDPAAVAATYTDKAGYSDSSEHVTNDSDDSEEARNQKKRKLVALPEKMNPSTDNHSPEDQLKEMKFDLRNHMHKVRQLGKELCARIRSFRFLESLMSFQGEGERIACNGGAFGPCPCSTSSGLEAFGAFTLCGHVGCLHCLQKHAERNECIEPRCKAQVQHVHIVPAKDFVEDEGDKPLQHLGSKLSAVVEKVKNIVNEGERVIVFVQFDDLKQLVSEALLEHGVLSLQVKGAVQQQVKALSVLQKEKPDKNDPKVILLKMDDETSAGVNLTTCNHAVFVHPLLAATQQEYEAYETQAIGRIRRYGQTKTVHVWRFLARNTIDTEIFVDRSRHSST